MLGLAGAVLAGCGGPAGRRALPTDRGTPLVYVALGDSTVEGVGASAADLTYVRRLHARLRTLYPTASLTNLGVGGATSDDVRARQLPRALDRGPHLVTLSVGPNDVTDRVPLERFEENVEAILAALHGRTGAVVVVSLLPDLAVTPRFRASEARQAVARRTEAFNQALAARARAWGAEIVDLHGPSRLEVPRRPELVASDGYHPSDAGYARWAELMWAAVQARLTR
jgi:lysophospholipase L1-like esterase